MSLLQLSYRQVFLAGGLALVTTSLAFAQGAPAPKPAEAPKAADATKPAEANKAAAGAAIPVGTTKPEAAAKPAAAAPATVDWKSMDKKARKAHMKKVVTPAMKTAFIAFDGKRYKTFGCVTCHGAEGIEKNTYKMPNAKLPRLPKDMAGFEALAKKKPEVMKFMGQEVKPKMAAMLGMPEYKPETGAGFGCNGCHMSEGQ